MEFEGELLKCIGPLAVLEVLSRGTQTCRELGETIARQSENILVLSGRSLQTLLTHLEAKGLVSRENRPISSRRQACYYYSLTTAGYSRLVEERAQWEKLQEGIGLFFQHAPHSEFPRPSGARP